MRALVRAGYDAVYLTEHHELWPDDELKALRAGFPKLLIFPGVELTVTEMPLQHLLVLGTNDPSYLTMDGPAAVLERARAEGHLTVLAHPCRWEGAGHLLEEGLRPDAIEFRTCSQDLFRAGEAMAWARQLGLPAVNAGDVHSLDMIGQFWIETAHPLRDADDIRDVILGGHYDNHPLATKPA